MLFMKNADLLTRAVSELVPPELGKEKLESGKPLRVYLGIDPTGAHLHLGHSVPLRKLKAFSDAGHHAIFLVGSYTAMTGDPTGRDVMRVPLTEEQVKENFKTYKEQASKILDFDKVEVRYNDEWLGKLSAADFFKIGSHFTIQQMLQRDMFKERMARGEDLSPLEFIYPLMQGYDSVVLDVDCEIGGNDQLFNMLCGRKLQKAFGKRDKFVLTTKLLEGTDGRKMSKTYDNCIYLDDEPGDMYGKVMRVKDDLMPAYFECCTDVPLKEVQEMEKAMKKGTNPKEFKMRLAKEIVTLYHGAEAAVHAESQFTAVFSKGGTPDDMPEVKAEKGSVLLDVLAAEGLVASKSEGRRLIEQGAVKVNDEVVTSIEAKVGEGLTPEALAQGVIVKVGKRKFVRIKNI